MKMKRASRETEHLGIKIEKGCYGYYPQFVNCIKQQSLCYDTAEQAVTAVLEGYRPKRLDDIDTIREVVRGCVNGQ